MRLLLSVPPYTIHKNHSASFNIGQNLIKLEHKDQLMGQFSLSTRVMLKVTFVVPAISIVINFYTSHTTVTYKLDHDLLMIVS